MKGIQIIYNRSLLFMLFLASFSSCDDTSIKQDAPVIGTSSIEDVRPDLPKILPYNLAARIKSTDDLTLLYAEIEESTLIDKFTMDKGPYTLFAPSNEALEEIDLQGDGLNIEKLLKKYMVEGKITTVALTKKIRSNGGSYTMNTLGGTKLVASKVGNVLYLKNSDGEKSEIGKSDIVASNGIIHVVRSALAI